MTHAALLLILAEGLLTVMDGIIKGLAQRYPTLQIAGLRFIFGFLWAAALVAVLRPGWPSLETVKANALRSALSVGTATLFFYALGVLPLAEVFALSFISPIFMVLLGVIILGETMEGRIATGLLMGLAGLALIVWHRIGTETYSPDALLGAAATAVAQAPAFAIPAHRAPWTAAHEVLDGQTMAAWLDAQGLDDAQLRWYLDYACRDDYGAGLDVVSAWAGLHYFASRHGFAAPGDGDEPAEPVFTWPEGNAWLVQRLADTLPGRSGLVDGFGMIVLAMIGSAVSMPRYFFFWASLPPSLIGVSASMLAVMLVWMPVQP